MTSRPSRSLFIWIPLTVILAGAAVATLVWQHKASGRTQLVTHLVEEAQDLRELQKDPSAALLKLKEAHRLDPDHPEVNREMGIACYDLNRMSEAAEYLEVAILHMPEKQRPEVSLWLGHVYRRQWVATGDKDAFRRARFAFEDATALTQQKPEALYHLGFLVLRLERERTISAQSELARAKTYLEELVEDHPDSELAEEGRKLLQIVLGALKGS